MSNKASALLRTILIGGAGSVIAAAAGLPAAALIGSSLAVSMAAWSGVSVAMHPRLRDVGFAGIGLSLGVGIQPTILQDVAAWATSLVLLCVSLAATLAVTVSILSRAFRFDLGTATLASSPGTMSYALAAAQEGRGDTTVVLVLQSLRLLVLASVLPVAIFFLVEPPPVPRPPSPWTFQRSWRSSA
jgi:uncharacterized protein